MTFEEFEAVAQRMWSEIPYEYREGVDGLVVRRETEAHPDHDDYYTMGTCSTEPYPSGYGGPESNRSILALYYGSFARVAESERDFPWEEEIWETITHELRHHLEFMVEDEALERLDYAMEQSHLRAEGLEFDPWYFQSGSNEGPGVYSVESDVYIEQYWRADAFDRSTRIAFDWEGRSWSIARPEKLGDLHYVSLRGLAPEGGWVQLVLVRELSVWQRAMRLGRRAPMDVLESEADPVPIGLARRMRGPADAEHEEPS